ncbi:MAG: tRNA pseudouridine(13) synthase TruD [Verrucomicrobiales bacterium]
MSPIAPPRAHGAPVGSARFKFRSEDFIVEEVLGFEPSGDGEHCCLWVEKIDRNSNDVATHIAGRLGVRRRLVSHCGLKDRHAVTRQWFSVHLPGQASPEAGDLEAEGLRVLSTTRNRRKLRRGTHIGNRFSIRLRECDFTAAQADSRWQKIITCGVPNYFGPQRFGRDGDNIRQAGRLFRGEGEVRDRALRGILISAARSYLFNAVIGERVGRGDWDRVLDGEVFGFADNRSLVLPERLRGDEVQRVAAGSLELTAPLWGGIGDLQSRDTVRTLEEEVVARYSDLAAGLEGLNLRQERRVIRLTPAKPQFAREEGDGITLQFELPKGTYATTILRELCELNESPPPAPG